jgi:hypothetical protein
MSFEYGSGPQVGESNATVLCRIVDKGADSPDSMNFSEPSDTPSSGAVSGGRFMLGHWGIAMLSVLAVA